MEIIKDIGSYAGFAAVVGLGVLAALYFSQARDLRRLREWAGRAPDREPTPTIPSQRVVATPAPKPASQPIPGGTPPKPAVPGARPAAQPPAVPKPPGAPGAPGRPVPAQAAAAGAAPAVAGGGPAVTPDAPEGEGPANGADGPAAPDTAETTVSQDTQVHPPPEPESGEHEALEDGDEAGEAASEEFDAQSEEFDAPSEEFDAPAGEPAVIDPDSDEFRPEDLWEGSKVAPAAAPAAASAARPTPSLPRREPPPATGSSGQFIPPYDQSRPGGPARAGSGLMSSPRRAVALIGGTIVAAIVVGFGIIQLTGGDDSSPTPTKPGATSTAQSTSTTAADGKKTTAIDPKSVTVAVLNGTTTPGLARDIGAQVEAQGFTLGNVTNSTDQQRAESVVLYAAGAEKEAAEVGKRLKISQREAIDPESQNLARDASVVVIAGQNLIQ